MHTLFLLTLSIVVASFVGYWIHRALHKPWSGPFYRGHMEHHLELYPPSRLASDVYQVAKWYHQGPVLFTPGAVLLIIIAAVITWLLGVSVYNFVVFSVGLVGFGLMNDYVHDRFHMREHWLHRFQLCRRMRRLHFRHHVDMTKNFGIVTLCWDKVFKSKVD